MGVDFNPLRPHCTTNGPIEATFPSCDAFGSNLTIAWNFPKKITSKKKSHEENKHEAGDHAYILEKIFFLQKTHWDMGSAGPFQ